MRLSDHEVDVIRSAVLGADPNARVWLFGSRVDDQRRGGDIDLLVESKVIGIRQKLDILVAIKTRIGEQRIDLLVTSEFATDADPFIRSIAGQVIEL